ncbi:hypothetical protein SAMN05421640_0837 [Ekhidna lutea]|uniref:Uncharacterized protein n=1 Tax=Ekhidna lutea TaxID=447679 RepID=A0A239FU29_EKHLU|nr:hypothetical protein [Ekhidna lutea]SNS60507.1 hypothetical protein SAMN05421640_0837 [Ekhidna lutea]
MCANHKYYQIARLKSHLKIIIISILFPLFVSCTDDEPALSDSFFKIYDDSNLDVSYNPIDVVETVDGFIILTGTELNNTDFMGVQLLKIDDEGNFEFDLVLDDYVVPVGEMYLNEADSNSYFFAMNPTTLEAILLGINPQLEIEVEVSISGINYPLSSNVTSGGNLLLQSYDPLSLETEISEIGLDGSFIGGNSYSIGPGDDVEEDIINHYLNATERPLPFFCGELSPGNYFFNGFYNYSFSLVFTDFSDAPTGVVQGQSTNAGLRAVMPLNGSDFAVAGYQFDANYQLASTTLTTGGISSSADLYPGNMAEIKPYTPTKIINYNSGSDYSLFVSETKGRQILLNFYASDGSVAGTHRIGYLNPFTFSSVKEGADNSLLIVGTTFVAGRFERISLIKIASSEISSYIN